MLDRRSERRLLYLWLSAFFAWMGLFGLVIFIWSVLHG